MMTNELIEAVLDGDVNLVNIALGNGARMDERYNLENIIETAGDVPETKYGLLDRVVQFHTTAIHQASRKGNLGVLEALLDSSPIIDIADSDGKKPWELGRNKECVKLWSEKGADVRRDLITKFKNDDSFLKVIHDATPVESRSALLSDIAKVSPKIMGRLNGLIEASAVSQVPESKTTEVSHLAETKATSGSAVEPNMPASLVGAVIKSDLLKISGLLVSGGVDSAARYNLKDMTETAGGIPESKYGLIDQVYQYHTTAIHQASRIGDAAILGELLGCATTVDVVDSDGNKPWQLGRDKDCVKLWSEKGADVRRDLITKFKDDDSYLKVIHDATPKDQRRELLSEIDDKVRGQVWDSLQEAITQDTVPQQREQKKVAPPAVAKTTSAALDLEQQKGHDQGQSFSK